MTTKRSPLALYESLLAAVEGGDEGERVRTLRRWLREPPTSWPPALREVVGGAGVGAGYLTPGLLSIHRFAPDVRRALAAGLPFAVARLVNGLPTVEARGRPLAPLDAAAARSGPLLAGGVAARVERLARSEARSLDEGRPAAAPRRTPAAGSSPTTPCGPRAARGATSGCSSRSRARRRARSRWASLL